MEWKSNDPRHDINKRDYIVVLCPHTQGSNWQAGIGSVETHQGYNIILNGLPRTLISENDSWPEGWLWTFQPPYK